MNPLNKLTKFESAVKARSLILSSQTNDDFTEGGSQVQPCEAASLSIVEKYTRIFKIKFPQKKINP